MATIEELSKENSMVRAFIITFRAVLLGLAGAFIGLVLGLMFVSRYLVVEAQNINYSQPVKVTERLEVVNNYGEQKTANVHFLEPKVSDVYYQYAPNKVQYVN